MKNKVIIKTLKTEPEKDRGFGKGATMRNRVKEAREHRGYTRYYVALNSDISYNYLAKIEDQTAKPNVYISLRIAQTIGCTVEDIFKLN